MATWSEGHPAARRGRRGRLAHRRDERRDRVRQGEPRGHGSRARRPSRSTSARDIEGTAAERPYKATLGRRRARSSRSMPRSMARSPASAPPAACSLEPFAAMPLRALELHAKDVDLSHGMARGPRTRLAVDVKLAGEGKAFAGPVRIDERRTRARGTGSSCRSLRPRGGVVVTHAKASRSPACEVSLAGRRHRRAAARRCAKTGVEAKLAVAERRPRRAARRAAEDAHRRHRRGERRPRGAALRGRAQGSALRDRGPRRARQPSASRSRPPRVRTGGGSVVARGGIGLAGRARVPLRGRGRALRPRGVREDARRAISTSPSSPAARWPVAITGEVRARDRAQHLRGHARFRQAAGRGRPAPHRELRT